MFLETSALTGENVEEAFLKCARTILNKIDSGEAPDCPEWEWERKAGLKGLQGTIPDLSPAPPPPPRRARPREDGLGHSVRGCLPSPAAAASERPGRHPSAMWLLRCARSQVGAWGPGTAGVGSRGILNRDRDTEKKRP